MWFALFFADFGGSLGPRASERILIDVEGGEWDFPGSDGGIEGVWLGFVG